MKKIITVIHVNLRHMELQFSYKEVQLNHDSIM